MLVFSNFRISSSKKKIILNAINRKVILVQLYGISLKKNIYCIILYLCTPFFMINGFLCRNNI